MAISKTYKRLLIYQSRYQLLLGVSRENYFLLQLCIQDSPPKAKVLLNMLVHAKPRSNILGYGLSFLQESSFKLALERGLLRANSTPG